MAQKSIQGSQVLAQKIRLRRQELSLTIEEAAMRAGVGTKTWCRYEAGESIRADKCKGICKALSWRNFPNNEEDEGKKSLLDEYKNHEAWSQFLENNYGEMAAISFAAGSDILLDYIREDLSELALMPRDSHLGQLSVSLVRDILPPQFLMQYNYDFLYHMECSLLQLRKIAGAGGSIVAHSVMDELIIYLCNEEAMAMLELSVADHPELDVYDDWVFDLFGDMDIITFLYSNQYLDEDVTYHFVHWNERQFYIN